MWLFLVIVVLLAAALLFVVWKLSRRRRLPAATRLRLLGAFTQIEQLPDPHRKILEAEKVLDQALTTLTFSGTFGEKLTKAGPRFSDVQAIWRAHKLRNRIAHEMNVTLGSQEVTQAIGAFKKGVGEL